MTVAICLRCGVQKHGALTQCPRCNFDPESASTEELAKSLMLSDHQLTHAQLEEIGRAIEAGNPPQFDEEDLKETVAELETIDMSQVKAEVARDIRTCFIVVAVVVVGLIWIVFQLLT